MATGNPRAAIAEVLRRTSRAVRGPNWIHGEVFRLGFLDEEVRRRSRKFQSATTERFAFMIEVGQRRGVLRAETDPLIAASLLVNALEFLLRGVLLGRVEEPEWMIAEITDMLCRYLVKEK